MKSHGEDRGLGLLSAVSMAVLIALTMLPGRASAQVADDQIRTFVRFDQLEHRWNKGANVFRWDAQGWIGGDWDKFWIKTEGEQTATRSSGDAEVQALYSRLVAPFWDFQAGLRYDARYGSGRNRSRAFAVIGVQGLAPYWFDAEPALFISEDGDVSARFTGTYDLLLTQRLIAQPRLEVNAAAQRVEKFGIGAGVNDIELGVRVRYEIRREFAPYVGISWARTLGDTADLARRAGDDVDDLAVVVGLRLWW